MPLLCFFNKSSQKRKVIFTRGSFIQNQGSKYQRWRVDIVKIEPQGQHLKFPDVTREGCLRVHVPEAQQLLAQLFANTLVITDTALTLTLCLGYSGVTAASRTTATCLYGKRKLRRTLWTTRTRWLTTIMHVNASSKQMGATSYHPTTNYYSHRHANIYQKPKDKHIFSL